MTVKTAICRDVCNTSTGTQTFFFPELGGQTPVAVWFIISRAISDGAAADHAVLGFGAATATDERWACGASAEHNQGTTDTYRRGVTDECVLIINPADGTVDGEADLSSFGAGTVVINWGDAPAGAYLITVIALAGDGVSGYAGTFAPHATVDNAVDVTGPGFEPDLLMLASICQTFDDSVKTYGMLSHGFAVNDGSDTQGCWFWRSQDAAAAAALISRCTHTYAFLDVGSAGSVNYAVEIGSWDASGFSATSRVGGNSESDDVGYLALYFSGECDTWGDVITAPTSIGNESQTGPSFEPQLVVCGLTQMASLDTTYTDGTAGCIGTSAFTPGNEYSTSIADEDGADPTDAQSICNNIAIDIPQDDGSTGIRASFVSMDTNGWTWNYSDVLGSARQMFAVAISLAITNTVTFTIDAVLSGKTKTYVVDTYLQAALSVSCIIGTVLSGPLSSNCIVYTTISEGLPIDSDWTDSIRQILGKLEVNWNADGSTWTEESDNLLASNGTQQTLPLWFVAGNNSSQQPWTANFSMRNVSDRYSPTNTSSPIYSNISANKGHGIPIRFSIGLYDLGDFVYNRVFTGYIDTIQMDSTKIDRCTFSCIDNSLPLLQRKVVTTMYVDQYTDDWLGVLASEASVSSTDLDEGLFRVPFCWCDDENSWTEMCKASNADGGVLFFDRNGTLTFENAEAWAADTRHNTSQHTFTVSRVGDYSVSFDWQDVYNEVLVDYAPRVQKGQVSLYDLDEVVWIIPGDTKTFTAYLRQAAASINTPVANEDFLIVAANGDDLTDDVSVSLTKYGQRVEVELVNNHAYNVAYVDTFRLTGRPLVGYKALREKLQATDSDVGDPTSGLAKTLRVSDNEYMQTPTQARFIAELMRDRTKTGRQAYVAKDVPAIPTLQPGDRVTVVEAGSELNNTAYITKIDWSYAKGAFKATYDLIDDEAWFIYTDTTYFRLGTDETNSSQRVFY